MSDFSDATKEAVPSAATPRCWFYAAAVLFMLLGVATAFVKKGRESAVGITVAKRIASGVQETDEHRNAVEQLIRDAGHWANLSLAAVFLAFVSWGIAFWRREKRRGTWAVIVSLFALYVGLELIMV